jgi:RND family efflux transporter MFP subunit
MSTTTEAPRIEVEEPLAPPAPTNGHLHPQNGQHHDDEVGDPPEVPRWRLRALFPVAALAAAILAGLFILGWIPRARRVSAIEQESQRLTKLLPKVLVVQPRQSAAITTALLPGDIRALEETMLYPQTTGYVKRWLADIGDEVEEGQLLAEISTPEVDQQLQQAKATLEKLRAGQVQAEADLKLADLSLRRYESLGAKAATQQELDQRRAGEETAKANVESARAAISEGEANVQRISEMQGFAKIVAPFAGTITLRDIDVGKLVTPGTTARPLFRIAKTDPVRVFVNVPQIYSNFVKQGLEGEVIVRELPGRKFVGKVTRTAKALDHETRTLLTELQVANPDHTLLTGSYVQVKMDVARENPPLLIPATALLFNAKGTRVAVVDAQNQVHFKAVEVAGDFGADLGIASGLLLTDAVVTNPGDRLTEGGEVEIEKPKPAAEKAAPEKPAAPTEKSAETKA